MAKKITPILLRAGVNKLWSYGSVPQISSISLKLRGWLYNLIKNWFKERVYYVLACRLFIYKHFIFVYCIILKVRSMYRPSLFSDKRKATWYVKKLTLVNKKFQKRKFYSITDKLLTKSIQSNLNYYPYLQYLAYYKFIKCSHLLKYSKVILFWKLRKLYQYARLVTLNIVVMIDDYFINNSNPLLQSFPISFNVFIKALTIIPINLLFSSIFINLFWIINFTSKSKCKNIFVLKKLKNYNIFSLSFILNYLLINFYINYIFVLYKWPFFNKLYQLYLIMNQLQGLLSKKIYFQFLITFFIIFTTTQITFLSNFTCLNIFLIKNILDYYCIVFSIQQLFIYFKKKFIKYLHYYLIYIKNFNNILFFLYNSFKNIKKLYFNIFNIKSLTLVKSRNLKTGKMIVRQLQFPFIGLRSFFKKKNQEYNYISKYYSLFAYISHIKIFVTNKQVRNQFRKFIILYYFRIWIKVFLKLLWFNKIQIIISSKFILQTIFKTSKIWNNLCNNKHTYFFWYNYFINNQQNSNVQLMQNLNRYKLNFYHLTLILLCKYLYIYWFKKESFNIKIDFCLNFNIFNCLNFQLYKKWIFLKNKIFNNTQKIIIPIQWTIFNLRLTNIIPLKFKPTVLDKLKVLFITHIYKLNRKYNYFFILSMKHLLIAYKYLGLFQILKSYFTNKLICKSKLYTSLIGANVMSHEFYYYFTNNNVLTFSLNLPGINSMQLLSSIKIYYSNIYLLFSTLSYKQYKLFKEFFSWTYWWTPHMVEMVDTLYIGLKLNLPQLLAKYLASSYGRAPRSRLGGIIRKFYRIVRYIYQSGVSLTGLRIKISGKLIRSTGRTLHKFIKKGQNNISTISQFVNYAFVSAHTKHGSIGIKIWMFYSNFNINLLNATRQNLKDNWTCLFSSTKKQLRENWNAILGSIIMSPKWHKKSIQKPFYKKKENYYSVIKYKKI